MNAKEWISQVGVVGLFLLIFFFIWSLFNKN